VPGGRSLEAAGIPARPEEGEMGTVHRFPSERVRGALYPVERARPAEILILPAIRIERHEELPEESMPPEGSDGSKNRRRARRG
jgi:hypothetical protein